MKKIWIIFSITNVGNQTFIKIKILFKSFERRNWEDGKSFVNTNYRRQLGCEWQKKSIKNIYFESRRASSEVIEPCNANLICILNSSPPPTQVP